MESLQYVIKPNYKTAIKGNIYILSIADEDFCSFELDAVFGLRLRVWTPSLRNDSGRGTYTRHHITTFMQRNSQLSHNEKSKTGEF